MWPLPNIQNEFVSFILNSHSVSCCWIKKQSSSYVIHAYKTFSIDSASPVINHTHLKKQIFSFLHEHTIENAFISLGISGTTIIESMVELPKLSPKAEDFKFPKLKKMVWDFRYLYPQENGNFVYYVCGLSRELLFQYQLLAITLSLNLVTLTTERMALFALYNHLHAHSFRHSKLAHDMLTHNNDIHSFFTPEIIKRLSSVPRDLQPFLVHNPSAFATHLGLYICQERT